MIYVWQVEGSMAYRNSNNNRSEIFTAMRLGIVEGVKMSSLYIVFISQA